ncbi:hypothetical protein LCGC14_1644630 [marine sediment metagenome]|uniref:Uncharacterized protein n=1 Tax=marine sediment metagenome TaxID=412755 RepID=A0A0F9KYI2_9ZZZZ
MHERTLEELYKTFKLKARAGQGGKTFKYVPSSDIMDRMNKIFKGNWSTEVVKSEIIGDQVLVLVRVMAKDPNEEGGIVYFHEGYASHPLAKFSGGVKQGQIIDAGNSYRSAMSKAVKAAVTKWGVGLYLEGEESESTVTEEVASVGPVGYNPPPATRPENPVIPPKAPVTTPSISTPPSVGADISYIPPVETAKVATPLTPPVFTNEEPVVEAAFTPPITAGTTVAKEIDTEYMTPVQKVAIETILAVHSIDFPALASKAIVDRTDNLPTSMDRVDYHDAVKIIQYGNNIGQE